MPFTFTHRTGGMGEGDEASIPLLLAELDGPWDDEHPDVSVTENGSSWCISVFQSGNLVLENLADSAVEPRHIDGASRAEVGDVLTLFMRGGLAAVEALNWRPGYT